MQKYANKKITLESTHYCNTSTFRIKMILEFLKNMHFHKNPSPNYNYFYAYYKSKLIYK